MSQAPGRRFPSCYLSLLVIIAAAGADGTACAGNGGTVSLLPGNGGLLDRVASAVEGAESSHGVDPQMWHPEPDGPQGPMQVSAAAAVDVGGGDRFDEKENRALGRAYLDRMYRRYGSWPDAIAAYNWGPGALNRWISGGRPGDKFPAGVARYRTRVLATSGLPADGPGEFGYRPINIRLARLEALRLEAKREMADRRRQGHRHDEVELLYADIMRATDPGNNRTQ
jgi:Transglycosylase SLT domain